ncbi:YqhG family protein [Brevibacillus sp. DP1.3A]|uniref:YqhG family protein n=1 Tax=Brevibacillus sp. DP1.3A TaxID=2738867 RepID=UPI00156B710A|nr:YqhG family protein [Brevibacillus sp. DP1.3A]UED72870.1 YqhG family protein [Brevibacillus sp. DP1.3A]
MQQQQVRQFVERYLATFSAHIVESHPDYFTVKLPVEVDKDIGNRPFYWSWVDKMNLAYQPLVLTFTFHPDCMPEGLRSEHLHLGAARMQQIFASTKKHGSFVCMYEQQGGLLGNAGKRRSTPLVPWLGMNLKVSLLCDKRRDILLYLGINLHQPRMVTDFTSFLFSLSLTPAIPDYYYTLDRKVTIQEALQMAQQEVEHTLEQADQQWAEEARTRLSEEMAILEAYYEELARREPENEQTNVDETGEEAEQPEAQSSLEQETLHSEPDPDGPTPVEQPISFDEYRASGGRILDFLRANGIQTTSREEINQAEWKKSTPDEERQRRKDELAWQYEPRIEVSFINGGLFYLSSVPPLMRSSKAKSMRHLPASGRIM